MEKLKKLLVLGLVAVLHAYACYASFTASYNGTMLNFEPLTDNTATVIALPQAYGQYAGDIVIPEQISLGTNTYTIVGIKDQAFSGCTTLTSVSMPESVLDIGTEAFYNCTALITVELPQSLLTIGNSAFEGCTALQLSELP